MIFQEPMTSLDPVLTVGGQIAEVIRLHQEHRRRRTPGTAVDMLRLVRIPEPERRARRISASNVGRHAAARHDRDGAVVRPRC